MDKQKIKQLIAEIEMLLDAPSSGFQEEGERWAGIVDLINEMLKEIKK
jgi:hypothetical protein